MLIDEVPHGAKVRRIFGECGSDGGFERGSAMTGEQLQQPSGEHPEVGPACGGAQEQRLGTRGGVLQAVLCAMGAGGAFVGHQRGDMRRVLDLRPAVEAARVLGDHVLVIDDAHGLEAGEHGERAVHMGVRNAVVVPVETHVGGLVRAHLNAFFARERMGGQSEQLRLFLGKDLAYAAAAIFGTRAVGGGPRAPSGGLGIAAVVAELEDEIAVLLRAKAETPSPDNQSITDERIASLRAKIAALKIEIGLHLNTAQGLAKDVAPYLHPRLGQQDSKVVGDLTIIQRKF